MPTAVTVQSDADIAQQQRLSEIPGLEVDCGLSALRGSVPKYKKLLGLFADRYDSFPEKIAELASAGELTGMETLVHTLRGAAAILGATDVSESASAVLSALRTKSQVGLVHELSVALARKLANLIDEIRRLPQ